MHLSIILMASKFIISCCPQLDETRLIAEALLGDLNGYQKLHKDMADLKEELQTWRRDQFDEWTRDIQSLIDENWLATHFILYQAADPTVIGLIIHDTCGSTVATTLPAGPVVVFSFPSR